MTHRKTSQLISLILTIAGVVFASDSAEAQRRFQLGGPLGIGIGGGQGLTVGGGYGVQLGGGQGLRFGPPNTGVQYGGGQGARFGTPNRGLQFGGGQLLRLGGPNAGIRLGEDLRVDSPQPGFQYNSGNGLQAGQFAAPNQQYVAPQPYGAQFPLTTYPTTPPQPIQPYYGQPTYPSPVIQPQAYPTASTQGTFQNSPTFSAPVGTTETNFTPSQNQTQTVVPQVFVPQTQFDAARQATVTPSPATPEIEPAKDVDAGISVLQLD